MNEITTSDFGEISVEDRDCPHCGTNNDDVDPSSYSDGNWQIRDCRTCGFVYIDKAPLYSYLSEEMAWEVTTKAEEARRKKIRPLSYKVSKLSRWRLHMFPRKGVPHLIAANAEPGNILDIGCGDGLQLNGLAESFVPHGIEISKGLAATADGLFKKQGGFVINAPAVVGIKHFADNFFSAVNLRSYLEHEMHPFEVLTETHRALCPGGVALIKAPNFGSLNRMVMGKRWCGFRYPDHLNYFTARSLKKMGEKCGFLVSYGVKGRIPTSDNLHAVFTKP